MRDSYADPTVCQLCGKNLNCMANVLSHSYLHQNIKPYKCPKCKYATRTRFNLRVHFGSCAKIEKFSYKRGTTNGRKRKSNNNGAHNNPNKRRRKSNRNKTSTTHSQQDLNGFIVGDQQIQYQQNNINTMMYNDDLLNQLPDSGPSSINDRDTSCLVQVHIQHFPRSNQINTNLNSSTDRYYQQQSQNNNNNNTTKQMQSQQFPSTDIKQFYNQPQTETQPQQQQQIQFTVADVQKPQQQQQQQS